MEERYRLLLNNLEKTKKEYNDIYVKVEKLKKIKAIIEQKIGDKSITQQDLDKINCPSHEGNYIFPNVCKTCSVSSSKTTTFGGTFCLISPVARF